MTFSCAEPLSEAVQRMHETEDQLLAAYAMRTAHSRGRRHREPQHPYRPAYVRDRDRIIHSSGFRRLMSKTQVFVGQPQDYQRTRLTHTLEVSQIARTIARNLRLNEDFTETVALAHDLGHPPFGHAGERALKERMVQYGGFEHNRQGLRLVEQLEVRYPAFPGLNLSYETLQSIGLHSKERDHPELAEFEPQRQMLAEAQVVDLADSIAYDTHDVDDALHAELISFDDLRSLEMWRLAEERARQTYGAGLADKQLARAVIRSLIDWQVNSLLTESSRRLEHVCSVDDVRNADRLVVALESEVVEYKSELERFLFQRVYRNDAVERTTQRAERLVAHLFDELVKKPRLMPERFQSRLAGESTQRVACDYIAGMTDRYAQRKYRTLFEP